MSPKHAWIIGRQSRIRFGLHKRAVGLHVPPLHLIAKQSLENLPEALSLAPSFDGSDCFDPRMQISVHPIRRADEGDLEALLGPSWGLGALLQLR